MTSFASALLLSALVPAGHTRAGGCPGASGAAPYVIQANGRFPKPVFANVKVNQDIADGEAVTDAGAKQTLMLDVFEPEGDTAPLRSGHPLAARWLVSARIHQAESRDHRRRADARAPQLRFPASELD
jgi:hypothetical protein